jgi:hypothetical protein
MNNYTEFDKKAKYLLNRLFELAPNAGSLSERKNWRGVASIGAEIEVNFSSYFPEFYKKYIATGEYKNGDFDTKGRISKEIAIEEDKYLLPTLLKTQKMGLPKGQDGYWEFAFLPVNDVYILLDQINLLRHIDLLPKGEHSLHLTLGDVQESEDVYYMLLLLEMLWGNKNRIYTCLNNLNNPHLSGSFGKKGRGGVFVKAARELEGSTVVACELRTLSINITDNRVDDLLTIRELLETVSLIAGFIKTAQNPACWFFQTGEEWKQWERWKIHAQNILEDHGVVADSNWGKPHQSRGIWEKYCEEFDKMSLEFKNDGITYEYTRKFTSNALGSGLPWKRFV